MANQSMVLATSYLAIVMFKEWFLTALGLAVYLFDVGCLNEVHRIDWTRSGVSQFGPK